MAHNSHPPSDKEEVIQRLINENAQCNKLINELKLLLNVEIGDFDTHSLMGGIKALIKSYHEIKDKNYKLIAENVRLKNKR